MTSDAVDRIRSHNAGRDPERLQLKFAAMRASPFAFLRGSCHLFYASMARGGVHKAAPAAWVCGDLHLENFGSYRAENGLVYFDINDFDESALAPLTWDLVRFLASVQVGAATLGVGDGKAERLCDAFVQAYAEALSAGKAYWVERDTATGLVRDLLDDLRQRDAADFVDGRTRSKGRRRVLNTDGAKALPATAEQRDRVEDFLRRYASARPGRRLGRILDVARRIAGTGSLGVERYVVLVRDPGAEGGSRLLDLKVSAGSSLVPRLKVVQPRAASHAARIVAAQRRLQAVPMDFLEAVQFSSGSAVLRGLQPSEDRVELDRARGNMKSIGELLATMGRIVAWAHLRSAGQGGADSVDDLIAFGRRRKWRQPLLEAAQVCAARVRSDSVEYNKAWDAGALAL